MSVSKVKFTLSLPFDCFVRKVSKYLLRIGIFKPFEALTSLLLYALAARFRSLSIDLMHHVFRRFWKLLHFIKNNMQIFLIFVIFRALPRGVSVIQGRPGFLGVRYTGAF